MNQQLECGFLGTNLPYFGPAQAYSCLPFLSGLPTRLPAWVRDVAGITRAPRTSRVFAIVPFPVKNECPRQMPSPQDTQEDIAIPIPYLKFRAPWSTDNHHSPTCFQKALPLEPPTSNIFSKHARQTPLQTQHPNPQRRERPTGQLWLLLIPSTLQTLNLR